MKVTALIPDKIIHDVREYTKGKNITESLLIALNEWLAYKHIQNLHNRIDKNPLAFTDDFAAETVRDLNRKK
jgi:hypothetical protein